MKRDGGEHKMRRRQLALPMLKPGRRARMHRSIVRSCAKKHAGGRATHPRASAARACDDQGVCERVTGAERETCDHAQSTPSWAEMWVRSRPSFSRRTRALAP
jgi:hypothetical protein